MKNRVWKKRTTALIGAALLVSFGVASAGSESSVVTGHSTYVNMSALGDDNCLAGIVGMVNQRVTWFNGQTLFKRSAAGSGMWVYATESLHDDLLEPLGASRDPSEDENLIPTGNVYHFADPNYGDPSSPDVGHWWAVHEFQQIDPALKDSVTEPIYGEEASSAVLRYVYAVELSEEELEDFGGITGVGTFVDYNFVMLVNTCNFRTGATGVARHDTANYEGPAGGRDYEGECAGAASEGACTQTAHKGADGEDVKAHEHSQFQVDMFVGKAPSNLGLLDGSEDGEVAA